MRANEFLIEGLWDSFKNKLYGLTGVDDKYGSGKTEGTRKRFIGNFITYFNSVKKSSDASGMPLDIKRLVNAYLKKNRWMVTDQAQIQAIRQVVIEIQKTNFNKKSIEKLANMMYAVGMAQARDRYGNVDNSTPDQLGGDEENTTASTAPDNTTTPTATAPATTAPTTTTTPSTPKTPEQIRKEKQAGAISNINRQMSMPPKGSVVNAGPDQYKWLGAQWVNSKTGRMADRMTAQSLNNKWKASTK